jgi:hypothetical protein
LKLFDYFFKCTEECPEPKEIAVQPAKLRGWLGLRADARPCQRKAVKNAPPGLSAAR